VPQRAACLHLFLLYSPATYSAGQHFVWANAAAARAAALPSAGAALALAFALPFTAEETTRHRTHAHTKTLAGKPQRLARCGTFLSGCWFAVALTPCANLRFLLYFSHSGVVHVGLGGSVAFWRLRTPGIFVADGGHQNDWRGRGVAPGAGYATRRGRRPGGRRAAACCFIILGASPADCASRGRQALALKRALPTSSLLRGCYYFHTAVYGCWKKLPKRSPSRLLLSLPRGRRLPRTGKGRCRQHACTDTNCGPPRAGACAVRGCRFNTPCYTRISPLPAYCRNGLR